jgi:hypothetical protein
VDGLEAACYPERVVSRRLPSTISSTILACAALAVYALAIAAPGALPVRTVGNGAGAGAAGPLLNDGLHSVARHAPRSDEHLTRQRDSRTGGTVHISLPVAVLPVAWTSDTVDSARVFRLESEQQRVPIRIVSARTSRGPPDRRA